MGSITHQRDATVNPTVQRVAVIHRGHENLFRGGNDPLRPVIPAIEGRENFLF